MNTNVHIVLSDDERARVGAAVYGKPTPVTRKQVNEIVQILFDYLRAETTANAPPPAPVLQDIGTFGKLGPESTLYEGRGPKPAKPNDPDYMRGWRAVGKAIAEGRLRK